MMRCFLLVLLIASTLSACRKDEEDPAPAKLQLSLTHRVGNAPLIFDSIIYRNGADELFSVSRLNYFLSNITFYRSDAAVYKIDTIAYIDAKNQYTFNLPGIPAFSYDSVSYSIGVPATENIHGKLPSTYENVAMDWPDAMGGGYHFLKLEGHWKDAGSTVGYTFHLGTDHYLVRGGFKASGQISANAENSIALKMDVAEWMERPHSYSFAIDGVYTMGNAALMQMVSENGRDVIQKLQ